MHKMQVLMTKTRAVEDAKEVVKEEKVAEEVATEQEESPDWGDDDSA